MKRLFFFIVALLCWGSLLPAQEEIRNPYDGIDRQVDNIGGKAELKRLFEQELIYPEKSLKEKTGGTVTLKFMVLKNGSTRDLQVLKGVNAEIDAEALRIHRKLLFVPLVYRGEVSDSWHSVSFDFDPGKYLRLCRRRGYSKIVYKGTVDTSMTVFEKADTMPYYAAGDFVLADFIRKNLEYPRQAQLQNFSGTVQLSFVVEPSGMPSNIQVIKPVAGGCTEEAVRVLSLIRWEPGRNGGKLVRARKVIPFIFELKNVGRDNSIGEQR